MGVDNCNAYVDPWDHTTPLWWDDVTCGVTILCNSRTFTRSTGHEGMTCCLLPPTLKQGIATHFGPIFLRYAECSRAPDYITNGHGYPMQTTC